MESVVREVLEVVEDAAQNMSSNDFVEVDTFALNRTSNELDSVLTNILAEATPIRPDIVSSLRELHL